MTSSSGEAHFSSQARGVPVGPGRFVRVDDIDPVEFVPGLAFRPVLGENAMANFVSFAPHTVAPTHVHEEEQIVVVLEGEFEFRIDGTSRTIRGPTSGRGSSVQPVRLLVGPSAPRRSSHGAGRGRAAVPTVTVPWWGSRTLRFDDA